jgi:glyoxylase-like metal-dependent hydrolase (beta-lactamase superfamily II)
MVKPGGLPFKEVFADAEWDAFASQASWLDHQIDQAAQHIYLSFHSYVVRTGRSTILVDTCLGNDKERGGTAPFHMRDVDFLGRLTELGLGPADIDFVMCTHMHADHVGWNTQLVDGRWVPTFPNARYVFARNEYEHWERQAKESPDGAWQEASFFDSVLPVVEAGRATMVDMDHELEAGIWLEPAVGHSPGNTIINVQSCDASGVFTGDVVHHAAQLADPNMAPVYDGNPDQARATRKLLLERLADTPTTMLPAHFTGSTAGHVVTHGSAFRFNFLDVA